MAIMDRVRRGDHDLSGVPVGLRSVVEASLDPDPANRPTLDRLLGWLRPQTTRVQAVEPRPRIVRDDPYTVPLAVAAQAAADDLRDHDTHVIPFPHDEDELVRRPPRVRRAGSRRVRRTTTTRGLPATRQLWDEPTRSLRNPLPAPDPPSAAGGRCCSRAARSPPAPRVAAYPWVAVAVLVAVAWLLRSGSFAASAAGYRRRLRGRRWYDGVEFLLAAPWHLVRSIPGTLLLVLWAAGLAIAAALICYAVAAGLTRPSSSAAWSSRRRSGRARRVPAPLAAGPGGPPRLRRRALVGAGAAAGAGRGRRSSATAPTWRAWTGRPRDRAPWHGVSLPDGAARALIDSGRPRSLVRPDREIAERPVRRSVAPWTPCSTCRSSFASASSLPPDAPTSRPTGGFFVPQTVRPDSLTGPT